jgi:hypothetical protein
VADRLGDEQLTAFRRDGFVRLLSGPALRAGAEPPAGVHWHHCFWRQARA